MRNRYKAFTLTEMVVVMGIIILFIGVAIPTVRALMGSGSINMARNQLSAYLAGVREEAVAIQDVRGVAFMVNSTTGRIQCILVQPSTVIDSTITGSCILLDAVPNRDVMSLPAGVGLQTVFDGLSNSTSSASGAEDRYLGFNVASGTTPVVHMGGCILFDANGKALVSPYGYQMLATDGSPSLLCKIMGLDGVQPISTYATWHSAYIYGFDKSTQKALLNSQIGLVLFDYEAFKSLNFTDEDSDIVAMLGSSTPSNAAATYTGASTLGPSEQDEESWLDNNSTPLMLNRYNGTLIRAE